MPIEDQSIPIYLKISILFRTALLAYLTTTWFISCMGNSYRKCPGIPINHSYVRPKTVHSIFMNVPSTHICNIYTCLHNIRIIPKVLPTKWLSYRCNISQPAPLYIYMYILSHLNRARNFKTKIYRYVLLTDTCRYRL